MKRTVIFTLTLLPLLASCNTMQGIGEDLQAGGKAITGAASDDNTPPPQKNSQQKNTTQQQAYPNTSTQSR